MRCGEPSEGPQELLAYRGASVEVPGPYRPKLYQSAIPSLCPHSGTHTYYLYVLYLYAQDGLEIDCEPPSATPMRNVQGAGSQTKGWLILNPYYFVHLMYAISTAEPIKDIKR